VNQWQLILSPYLYIPLFSFLAVSVIMTLVFLWALKIKNNGVVDIFWAFNFLVIALIIWFLSDGYSPRKNVVFILASLWSLRLGIYLLIRVGGHLKEEEGRYRALRAEWSTAKFFGFYQMQAFSNVFLAIPFFIISLNKEAPIRFMEYVGAGLWFISICGEGISDWQLKHFKKDPLNKGKVCEYGLWNYSRHPNYFFQLMIWISVTIFALSSPCGWLSILCPLSIGFLIFKVTGIPMTEEQSVRSKGELYKNYQKTTSAFVPWFKKKQ
jgi:steroid 5-alpha reductase family enzyme